MHIKEIEMIRGMRDGAMIRISDLESRIRALEMENSALKTEVYVIGKAAPLETRRRNISNMMYEYADALDEIRDLAEWHYDPDVNPADASPDDMTAHINGLIVKLCTDALGEPDG